MVDKTKQNQRIHIRYVSNSCPHQTFADFYKDDSSTGHVRVAFFDPSAQGVEMEKRLNGIAHIPHAPKTNGMIPPDDQVTSDHQRLLNTLKLYQLEEFKITGDGNCQFRSLSHQLYGSEEHYRSMREALVHQLKSRRSWYEDYVAMNYNDYLQKMSRDGEWGDHVTLQAAADCYGFKIFVFTSYRDACLIEILPKVEKSEKKLPS